jgi:hypothetical protein
MCFLMLFVFLILLLFRKRQTKLPYGDAKRH